MTKELVLEEQLIPPYVREVFKPYGFVGLVECNATDLDVVNAARVSFAKKSEWARADTSHRFVTSVHSPDEPVVWQVALREDDERVLRYLMKNRHGTPFEHTYFKFHVRAPIFVFREWHRHRIGISINEESARYSPLEPHFYVPEGEALRSQTGKPGRYTFEPLDKGAGQWTQVALRNSYDVAYSAYERLMAAGVAKEIARACLPVGIYSQMLWTCNARSLMNFLSLRAAPTALYEIRKYAEAMEQDFKERMPVTYDAWCENGRVAP